jgi:hypothetical protein
MPLSEHEQRLLEQMERQLYADDPKLASTLRGSGRTFRPRHQVIVGVVGLALGLALLVAGVASQLLPLGVGGFLVMLASGWWASSGWNTGGSGKAASGSQGQSATQSAGGSRRRSGFMNRIEERWERRREGDA